MNVTTREQAEKLRDAWAHLPEGDPAAPLLAVPMTPAALLWFMSTAGMKSVETVVMPPEPYTIADVMEERPTSVRSPRGVMAFLRRLGRARRVA